MGSTDPIIHTNDLSGSDYNEINNFTTLKVRSLHLRFMINIVICIIVVLLTIYCTSTNANIGIILFALGLVILNLFIGTYKYLSN